MKRVEDDHRRDIVLAWQIERIAILSLKKDKRELPDLKKLLETNVKGQQSPKQQLAMIQALSGQLGTSLQRLRKGSDGRYHALS